MPPGSVSFVFSLELHIYNVFERQLCSSRGLGFHIYFLQIILRTHPNKVGRIRMKPLFKSSKGSLGTNRAHIAVEHHRLQAFLASRNVFGTVQAINLYIMHISTDRLRRYWCSCLAVRRCAIISPVRGQQNLGVPEMSRWSNLRIWMGSQAMKRSKEKLLTP